MSFVFLCSLLHAIAHKFPDIFVHDSYTVKGYLKKCYSHWAARNASVYKRAVTWRKRIIFSNTEQ